MANAVRASIAVSVYILDHRIFRNDKGEIDKLSCICMGLRTVSGNEIVRATRTAERILDYFD